VTGWLDGSGFEHAYPAALGPRPAVHLLALGIRQPGLRMQ
jgi:hypothetical protein